MKTMKVVFALALFFVMPLACSNHSYISDSPTYYIPTPTPTPTASVAVTIGATPSGSSYAYTSSNVTLSVGQSIEWDSSNGGHPLNIDAGSGSCIVAGQTSFPFTYQFMAAGTYHFHCGVHSSCASGSCPNPSTCTGMIGVVTVN